MPRVALALALALTALAACRTPPREPPRRAEEPSDAGLSVGAIEAGPPQVTVADAGPSRLPPGFCTDGFEPLDPTHEACVLVPASGGAASAPRLLVYLHGIVPPQDESPQKTNVLRVVAAAATRAGVVALVPRGVRGVGPKGAKDWYAWPTSPADHLRLARDIVLRIAAAKRTIEARSGRPCARTYLAGSSNGAYFLSALALRGELHALAFDVDGLGAMSGGAPGGSSPGAPAAGASRPPFYVGFGTFDEETKRGAVALGALLTASRWPAKVAEHALGHGAREIYLDEAFAFWDAAR